MGAIWFSRAIFLGTVSELIGYKAGLALDGPKMADLSPVGYKDHFVGNLDNALRIRSEAFEEIIAGLLYAVGNIDSPSTAPFGIGLFHRFRNRPKDLQVYYTLIDAWSQRMAAHIWGKDEPEHQGASGAQGAVGHIQRLRVSMGNESSVSFDRKEFAEYAYLEFGDVGRSIATEMIADFDADIHRSPWLGWRRTEFKDVVALGELFKSESLRTSHGTFLDQRFIDYLSANETDIGKINWRKFEGLVGEYFTREGWIVDLGPGRGDDGVDARIWAQKPNPGDPATIVVQCKRQKEEISKVIVKSLWADVDAEGANSGLIVTTSRLSPGAKKTIAARQYPIQAADGITVTNWLRAMRSVGAGQFLAE